MNVKLNLLFLFFIFILGDNKSPSGSKINKPTDDGSSFSYFEYFI